MHAENLQQRIEAHRAELARIGQCVEQLTAAVEAATTEARDTLQTYRERKAEASATLAAASEQYAAARLLFTRGCDIERTLLAVKQEHVCLSREAVATRDDDAITQMQAVRRTFRHLAGRIERLRRDQVESQNDAAEGMAP